MGYPAFVDFETTGLDREYDQAVEFAAIVYEPKSRTFLKTFEQVFDVILSDEQREMLLKVCRIDYPKLAPFVDPLNTQFLAFCKLIKDGVIDCLVAHNALFDKAFFDRKCKELFGCTFDIRWIDSLVDFPFRDEIRPKELSYLAADHGFLNPFAHRGLSDCFTLFGIARQYDWDEIVAYADIPIGRFQAVVSFDDKDLARKKGFRWDGGHRVWWLDFKKTEDLPARLSALGFPTREIARW